MAEAVFVVLNHKRVTVHGITASQDTATKWCRELGDDASLWRGLVHDDEPKPELVAAEPRRPCRAIYVNGFSCGKTTRRRTIRA